MRPVLVALGLVLAATACGDARSGAGDDGEMTSRAVAAVMLDHLPPDTSRRGATYEDGGSPPGFVGADFRYRADGESDGDLVSVTLQRGDTVPPCDDECVDVGDGVRLRWDRVEPEEDPGIVYLNAVHHGTLVTVELAGPTITDDPRRMHLEPSYGALLALVRDDRLRLDPDAATVAAGTRVTRWRGGERDPKDIEAVPNDDQTVVTGFVFGWGDDWEYVGASPAKAQMGTGAIGGRAKVGTEGFEPVAPGFVDALAAPQPPPWLDSCLPGYTCRRDDQDVFAWRPAQGRDPGDAWIVHVEDGGETVALHTVGRRLPAKERAARGASGFFMFGPDFFDRAQPLSVGLMTTRERYEQARATTHG